MDERPQLKTRISLLSALLATVVVGGAGLVVFVVARNSRISEDIKVFLIGLGGSLIGSAIVSLVLIRMVEPWKDSAFEDVIRTANQEQIAHGIETTEGQIAAAIETTERQIASSIKANETQVSAAIEAIHEKLADAMSAVYISLESNRESIKNEINRAFTAREQRDINAPVRSFPASMGLSPEYNRFLVDYLTASVTYGYYGATAVFTAYRFLRLHQKPEVRSLKEIRISVVDPRADKAITAVSMRVRRNQDTVKREILLSLSAFFDLRDELLIEIYLNSDLTGRRLEVFDDAAFETLYVSGMTYPPTDVYAAGSRRYKACRSQIDDTARYSQGVRFGARWPVLQTGPLTIGDEASFESFLQDRGFNKVNLDAVRTERDERFAQLDDQLRRVGIEPTEQSF